MGKQKRREVQEESKGKLDEGSYGEENHRDNRGRDSSYSASLWV